MKLHTATSHCSPSFNQPHGPLGTRWRFVTKPTTNTHGEIRIRLDRASRPSPTRPASRAEGPYSTQREMFQSVLISLTTTRRTMGNTPGPTEAAVSAEAKTTGRAQSHRPQPVAEKESNLRNHSPPRDTRFHRTRYSRYPSGLASTRRPYFPLSGSGAGHSRQSQVRIIVTLDPAKCFSGLL